MQIRGGSSSGEDVGQPAADYTLDVDYEDFQQYQVDETSPFYQLEEQCQESALQGKPLKTPSSSPSSVEASTGCSSEAAWHRQSPADNCTPSAVMASPSTEHVPPQNANLHAQNSLTDSPDSINFDTSSHAQNFSNYSHHTIDPAYQAACQLAAYQGASHPDQYLQYRASSQPDQRLQGLGIHGYDLRLPGMAARHEHTYQLISERGYAYQDTPDMPTQYAQIHESEPARQGATGFEDLHHVEDDGFVTEDGNVTSTTYPSPEQYAQSNSNVPSTPELSKVDHNNFTPVSANTPCSTNTPRSTSTPAYSRNSDNSPTTSSTVQHHNFNIPESASLPQLKMFKKPAQHLTHLQMVDESSHQPTMGLAEVFQPDGSMLKSLDYRDQSWQGRKDEYKGWTPYLDYADFPHVRKMLQDMRSDPLNQTPDNATIFTSLEQVNEWREEEKLKASRNNQVPENENELPRTPEEKAAIVKLLFKAFKTTVEAQSNADVLKPFNNHTHSNAHVEAVCWQLLEGAIERSKGGPLCYAYEPGKPVKSASDRNLSFAQRIDNLIQALMLEKSVGINLLRAPKVCDAVDYPSWLGKRTSNNRNLNNKKAEIAKLGKKKLEELTTEDTDNISRKFKATSRQPIKRAKRSREQIDEDSESIETSPSKRQSTLQSAYTTPVKRFATLNPGYNDYPTQVSPSPAPAVPHYNTPASQLGSPGPSITSSVRGEIAGYNLNGISQPNFQRSIPQSPLRHTASLSTSSLPSHGFNREYGIQDDINGANDMSFGGGGNMYY
jgi:hypothetical protein